MFCESNMTLIELLNTVLAIVALIITVVGFFASLTFYREGMNLQNRSNDALARIEEMSRSLSTLIFGMFQQTLDAALNREPQSGSLPAPVQTVPAPKSEMEKKILNTLWTHQVNHFPDYSMVWTFRLNFGAPEFLSFREAANKLMGEGFVAETPDGQIYLTPQGYEYCKQHYKEFSSAGKWYPNVSINEENLRRVVGEVHPV